MVTRPAGGSAPAPVRLAGIAIFLAFTLWLAWFSPESYDSDFWWHLRTGQYIVQNHTLPLPDPFSYTVSSAPNSYPGEEITRHFNLTHEWLAQSIFYCIWRFAGFGGVVLFRALLLSVFSGLVGLIAWRRCGGIYRSLAAACAAAGMAIPFALDRPYLITFVLLALTIVLLEFRKFLWLLPAIFLFWANCHGGFFLGWLAMGAYCVEALWQRYRGQPPAQDRTLWLSSVAALLISGLNPNGFRILQVLTYYRSSELTSHLQEWARPRWFEFSLFTFLWVGGAVVLLWAHRRVRVVDWLLFTAFAAAALTAQRNTILIGLIAPVVIVSYVPWKRAVSPLLSFATAVVLIGVGFATGSGTMFQLRAAEWRYPQGAADFLLEHHIDGPIFNTYEYGGYLIWRLYPRQRVFIDGRSLSEAVFRDYGRILYNVEDAGGNSAQELLDRYGVQTIVMNTLEYHQGLVYSLAPALADPQQTKWKLIYEDATAIVLVREAPHGIVPLDPMRLLSHMEDECQLHLEHEPKVANCARAVGQVFLRIGDLARARKWYATYVQNAPSPAPDAIAVYQKLSR